MRKIEMYKKIYILEKTENRALRSWNIVCLVHIFISFQNHAIHFMFFKLSRATNCV